MFLSRNHDPGLHADRIHPCIESIMVHLSENYCTHNSHISWLTGSKVQWADPTACLDRLWMGRLVSCIPHQTDVGLKMLDVPIQTAICRIEEVDPTHPSGARIMAWLETREIGICIPEHQKHSKTSRIPMKCIRTLQDGLNIDQKHNMKNCKFFATISTDSCVSAAT